MCLWREFDNAAMDAGREGKMSNPSPVSITEAFAAFPARNPQEADLQDAAYVLATEEITKDNLFQIRPRVLTANSAKFRKQIIGLILFYVKICLRDHILLPEEKNNIRLLNILFKVEEGEYYKRQRKMLSDVLSEQVLWIIRDEKYDRLEDIFQTDLQVIFSLGTDQFNSLTRKAVMAFLCTMPKKPDDDWKERMRRICAAYLIADNDFR